MISHFLLAPGSRIGNCKILLSFPKLEHTQMGREFQMEEKPDQRKGIQVAPLPFEPTSTITEMSESIAGKTSIAGKSAVNPDLKSIFV